MSSTSGKKPSLCDKLVEDITQYISRHALSPGDRLPSMSELGSLFGVSDTTVRAALRVLDQQGIVESRERSGVFVRQQRANNNRLNVEKVIAVIVPNGDHPYEARIIRGVMEAASSKGYHVIIANSHDEAKLEASQLQALSEQVAGLIIFPAFESGNYAAYADLMERNIPFVFVDRRVRGLSVPLIATDNELGGYLATKHLIQTGRRRIFALSVKGFSPRQDRIEGFKRAMKEAGLDCPPSSILLSPTSNDAVGYLLTKELLQQIEPGEPFALFALNEIIARTSYAALHEAGLRIPEDVAVIGYDDISALYFDPPLTSVRQDPQRMGLIAAQALFEMVTSGINLSTGDTRLPPEVIVRNSTDTDSKFSLVGHLLDQITPEQRPHLEVGYTTSSKVIASP